MATRTLCRSHAAFILGERFLSRAELPLNIRGDTHVFICWSYIKSTGFVAFVDFCWGLLFQFEIMP